MAIPTHSTAVQHAVVQSPAPSVLAGPRLQTQRQTWQHRQELQQRQIRAPVAPVKDCGVHRERRGSAVASVPDGAAAAAAAYLRPAALSLPAASTCNSGDQHSSSSTSSSSSSSSSNRGSTEIDFTHGHGMGRRDAVLSFAASTAMLCQFAGLAGSLLCTPAALARERRRPLASEINAEDYKTSDDGLQYYDVEEGKGKEPEDGEVVKVHFEVKYRSLTIASTRESKLLGGNRSISQPYEFTIGAKPFSERRRSAEASASSDGGNGLFSAQAAPKPPKALYSAVRGMKVGGKRTVIVPPELGYGNKGYNEVPPGATIQLNIDLLEVKDVDRP